MKRKDLGDFEISLVDLESLRSHELVDAKRLTSVYSDLASTGVLRKPILVDVKSLVILDGHHRAESLRLLGCSKVPAIMIDYESSPVSVRSNSKKRRVSKKDVVAAGLFENPLPPKSSRHIYDRSMNVNVQLGNLK